MSRGLSALQRFILRRAGDQQRCSYAEVLVEYFGWQPVEHAGLHRCDGAVPACRAGDLRDRPPASPPTGGGPDPDRRRFDPDTIGRWRYYREREALTRACHRLAARGLVEELVGSSMPWQAVAITDAGRMWLATHPIGRLDDLPDHRGNR
jgi:hypothetical protein